jgi:hypothetical protein
LSLAEEKFDVGDFEITIAGDEQPLKFAQIENLTVNFDTNEGDGIGGTVVVRSRKKDQTGFYSGAPVTEVKWFDFTEAADEKIRKLCSRVSLFDVKVSEKHFVNSLFKRVYLNVREK